MKIFAIKSDSTGEKVLAYLIYHERAKQFSIELPDAADEWETPLLLSSFAKRGVRSINPYWSMEWVRQRIIPPDRQNIGMILKENGLPEYDEYKLLVLSGGRCAQDDCYIERMNRDSLPDEIRSRALKRIDDVVPLSENRLLVFFRDGSVKKCGIESLANARHFVPILCNEVLFSSVKVQTDGIGVTWGEGLEIPAESLYASGEKRSLTHEDFKSYAAACITDTEGACALLDCTRQNISDLVKKGKLHPLHVFSSGYIFLLSELRQRMWS